MNRRPLNDREKIIVRYGTIGVAIYLLLFGGFEVWKFFDRNRSDYRSLALEAERLRLQTLPYQDKVLVVKKMMDDFQLDPARLKKDTVVADASAAIQQAAKSGGVQLGSIRETPTHGSNLSLASVQLEGTGSVPAVLAFLAGLNTIGYPVVVDTVQFTADSSRPGQLKLTLTLFILDFDQQKDPKETTHA